MASPDGLRLFFGNRLPQEVLEHIFRYGFHLWLAKPHDVIEYGGLGDESMTAISMAVVKESLSPETRKLVNYDQYYNECSVVLIDGTTHRSTLGAFCGKRYLRVTIARPRIFDRIWFAENRWFRNYSAHLWTQRFPPQPLDWNDDDLADM